jgi:tetratricopeptide (TPR) repeat protein
MSPAQEQQLLETGKDALGKGDYDKAIEAFQKLAQAAPKVAEVHANLGAVYYFAGRYERAIRECRRALELKPALRRPGYFLGLSLAESGRCAEALPRLNRDYGSTDDAHLKRMMGVDAARCSMDLHRPQDAVPVALSLAREFPKDPEVLYLAAHLFSDLSNQASQRLLVAAPGSYQAHRFNAEVLEAQGKLKDAIDEYRKVLEINPHLDGIHYEIGRLLLATVKGNAGIDEGEAEFRKELEINPRSAPSEYELGNLAWEAKDWDKATQSFKRATELDPGMAAAWVGLGKALSSAGHYEQAVEPLERAVTLDPQDPDAHYRLAFALRHLGREKEAERELAAYRRAEQGQMDTRARIRQGMTGMGSQSSAHAPHE